LNATLQVTPENAEEVLRDDIGGLTHDPLNFARYAYPWKEGSLKGEGSDRVRGWQTAILSKLAEHLKNPATRYTPCQIAVASGHGIGKSALIAMVCNWAMSTCEDCKVLVTANTGTQLATKTGPEINKWFKLAINSHWFETKATSVTVRDPGHERLWRLDMTPWSKENTEAFAGLHNQGKRIVLIMDEASAIERKVWEVAEGAMTDENTEIIWLAFGNPTQNTGRFRECFGALKHRWTTFQIDSRNVEGTNKAKIAQWIADYGEDSDFVRVRVRGEFPRAGSSQFIASDIVAAARKYHAEAFEGMPKILSVDVARFGDDQTVIGMRQGRKLTVLAKLRGLDTIQVAERTIAFIDSEKPDAIVIDGDGLGAGTVDQLRFRGFTSRLFEFHGGATADDASAYYNRSAECWGLMRAWLSEGAEIPNDAELDAQLTGREYGFTNKGQIQLEKKSDMNSRGLDSPDIADMLSMTFSVKVLPKPKLETKPTWDHSAGNSWMGG
jgi:hypothetical protein